MIGSRKRGYIDVEDNNMTLVIRRLKCKRCGKIHHELPDILVPYKRHGSETIEEIIDEKTDTVCCEESTIRRIKHWFDERVRYFEGCLASIAVQHGATPTVGAIALLREMRENSGWLKSLVRIVVNSNLWVHTRSAFLTN